jgi:exonuclease III
VKFHLCNKEDNFKWALVVVYGPTQNDQKPNFLTELVQMGSRECLSILIGGDFNILRSHVKNNNKNYNARWPFLFNVVIDDLNLRELKMSGRKYTWANARDNPTYEKLDRILMSMEWEQKFPLSTVVAITREISDHTPLLIDTGHNHSCSNHTMFKFELGWLLRNG